MGPVGCGTNLTRSLVPVTVSLGIYDSLGYEKGMFTCHETVYAYDRIDRKNQVSSAYTSSRNDITPQLLGLYECMI